jgi:hypothetical protein
MTQEQQKYINAAHSRTADALTRLFKQYEYLTELKCNEQHASAEEAALDIATQLDIAAEWLLRAKELLNYCEIPASQYPRWWFSVGRVFRRKHVKEAVGFNDAELDQVITDLIDKGFVKSGKDDDGSPILIKLV